MMVDEAASDEAAWEPGAPSVRAMAPSIVFGALVPLAVYFLARPHVSGDATALMIAGAFPAAWIVVEWLRRRHLDPIGSIVLLGFVAGVVVSVALGGNAFVLKVRESFFGGLFGVACLLSLLSHRPMMFHIGKVLSAGDDEDRRTAYDAMWELPTAPRTFATITTCWGIGLIVEAGARVLLALTLPTGVFLAVAPVLAATIFGGLFAFAVVWSKRARRLGESTMTELGLTYPSVPTAGQPMRSASPTMIPSGPRTEAMRQASSYSPMPPTKP